MRPQTAVVEQVAPQTKLLLRVEDLKIAFPKGRRKLLPVVDTANLSLQPNESVGIVGESGSGKTMFCRALIGTLARHGAVITSGKISFNGKDLVGAPEGVWHKVRGREIGYVPQSSLAGLNPVLTIRTQLIESLLAFKPMDRGEAERAAVDLLDRVKIPRARQILDARSHQLSGGMRQRVMIAAAIAQGCGTMERIGCVLKAGTNCGSCIPELKKLLAEPAEA